MEYSPRRYLRVTLNNGHKRFFLEVVSEDTSWLKGYEVDVDGERISGRDWDERLRLIDKGAIKASLPYALNLHYGELERVKA